MQSLDAAAINSDQRETKKWLPTGTLHPASLLTLLCLLHVLRPVGSGRVEQDNL